VTIRVVISTCCARLYSAVLSAPLPCDAARFGDEQKASISFLQAKDAGVILDAWPYRAQGHWPWIASFVWFLWVSDQMVGLRRFAFFNPSFHIIPCN